LMKRPARAEPLRASSPSGVITWRLDGKRGHPIIPGQLTGLSGFWVMVDRTTPKGGSCNF